MPMNVVVATDDVILAHLREFEERRGMPSLEFFQKFTGGMLDDSGDNFDWVGWCRLAIVSGLFPPKFDKPMNGIASVASEGVLDGRVSTPVS